MHEMKNKKTPLQKQLLLMPYAFFKKFSNHIQHIYILISFSKPKWNSPFKCCLYLRE